MTENSQNTPTGENANLPFETCRQRFSVEFDYPVIFTRNVFDAGNPLLAETLGRLEQDRRHRVAVYIDRGVAEAHKDLIGNIKEYFHARPERLELAATPEIVPGGEQAKNDWQAVREIMWAIGNLHMDRQSFVIAVGGGSMLDMAGFAVSIVHRGLRLLRMPTTTLAQSDAGIGVKNGMDEHGMKNFVGTFAPPFAVINDFSFLATLPEPHWLGGPAEAFKVAVIKDAAFFDFLCDKAGDLRRRDAATMEQAIHRCAMLHLAHTRTGGDPFEFGSARPLDFGHWAAHKLETLSAYRIAHGQAVAIGIAVDSCYAMRQGLLKKDQLDRILAGLTNCGLPIFSELLEQRESDGVLTVLDGLQQFREHLGGSLTITLPDGIGNKGEVHQMNVQTIEEVIRFLKNTAGNSQQS
ncbi:MAG: 3-dehydroquinate synthase [Planctomycetota bacterium]|nr:3-dehydroquinate synthase [Planctomycetota bacterium]